MADVSIKEQKLAAARKKLRQFQKKKGDMQKILKSRESSPYLEVLGSQKSETSSSRSSSITDISESSSMQRDQHENKSNSLQDSSIEKLFLNNQFDRGLNGNQTIIEEKNNTCTEDVPYELSCENFIANPSSQTCMVVETYSEVSSNHHEGKPYDHYEQDLPNNVAVETDKAVEVEKKYCDKTDALENEGSVCSETNASVTTVLQMKNDSSILDPSQNAPLRSTAESLRQLSLQMSGLINHSNVQDSNEHEEMIKELEKRNSELASLLEFEKQKTFEHNSIIEEMKRTMDNQNTQIETLQKMTMADNSGTEIHGLREQLQVHIQTIGILVAEKSELQTSLSHARYSLDQKTGEISELQGRLDASREHVRHLETSSQELKVQISDLTDSKENESQQTVSLRSNNAKLRELCEEMRASTAELTERLAVRSEENKKLNSELTDARRQYELAQVLIEQLRTNSTEDMKIQLEQLQLTYNDSQNQIHISQTALEEAQNEKMQLEYEYKSYTNQLLTDMEGTKEKLANECKKREESEAREKVLEAELKSREVDSKLKVSLEESEVERNHLQQVIADVSKGRRILEEKCSSLARDNGQLSQLLAEQSAKLEALEAAADRHSTQEVDTTQLLQTMQSDKIAAARALSQNKQLKEQLEELQNGFIMMSNKKLELTEKLEKELHVKKNLYHEMSRLGEELASHKEIILAKQRELDSMKSRPISAPLHMLVEKASGHEEACFEQVVNGNHYHEEIHYVEHSQAHQNSLVSHAHENRDSSKDVGSPTIERAVEAIVSVCEDSQEKMEPNSIPQELKEKDESRPARVSSSEAHEALEKKFLQCMKDFAAVSDEKQNLEHLVQQLQLETETIGDYITIYQFQRGVMKQQMQELKMELEMLKTEKQEIVSKLSKLQKLVENLASDKDGLKEGFIDGISSIISSSTTEKGNTIEEEAAPLRTDSGADEVEPNPIHTSETPSETRTKSIKPSKTDTVKQIMDLISEMETTTQLDMSILHKFHPCSHCSGRLLTI